MVDSKVFETPKPSLTDASLGTNLLNPSPSQISNASPTLRSQNLILIADDNTHVFESDTI
jgi:hypothetical protein